MDEANYMLREVMKERVAITQELGHSSTRSSVQDIIG